MFKIIPCLIVLLTFVNKIRCVNKNTVDGEKASITDHPHAVYIKHQCSQDSNAVFTCGATIFTKRIILTAASCVERCKSVPKRIEVFAGSTDLKGGVVKRRAEKFIIHENYTNTPAKFADIAMIYVKKDLPLGEPNTKRARIPPFFLPNLEGIVAGWWRDEKSDTPVLLKAINRTVVNHTYCCNIIKACEGLICASRKEHSAYSYKGDPGSGLVTSPRLLIGIEVIGSPDNYVNAYTDVSYFYDWIMENKVIIRDHINSRIIYTPDYQGPKPVETTSEVGPAKAVDTTSKLASAKSDTISGLSSAKPDTISGLGSAKPVDTNSGLGPAKADDFTSGLSPAILDISSGLGPTKQVHTTSEPSQAKPIDISSRLGLNKPADVTSGLGAAKPTDLNSGLSQAKPIDMSSGLGPEKPVDFNNFANARRSDDSPLTIAQVNKNMLFTFDDE